MNDLEFHYEFVDLFASLRDFHTEYRLPGNHGCIETITGVIFNVIGQGDSQKIIVSGFDNDLPRPKNVNFGDELVSIDNIPIMDYLEDLKFFSRGANDSGSLRASIGALSYLDGKTNRLPAKDEHQYSFRSADGTAYQITMPWIVLADINCWTQVQSFLERRNPPSKIKRKVKSKAMHNLNRKKQSSISSNLFKRDKPNVIPTVDPMVNWHIHRPNTKNLGVIHLDDFAPLNVDSYKVAQLIQNLLMNELKDTSAILFDVRYNGGGLITIADVIPQFFGREIKTSSAYALIHDINRDIFLDSITGNIGKWGKHIKRVSLMQHLQSQLNLRRMWMPTKWDNHI